MENFILNEIYDLQNQRKFIDNASSDAYSLYSKLQKKQLSLKQSVEELVIKHKLYFPLEELVLYSGMSINNIDLVFLYKDEIRIENLWSGFIDSDGIIRSYDESEYEFEYENKDGIITYRYINYEPYNTITIPNVLGFINLEYTDTTKTTHKIDYNIPERSYK